MLAAILRTLTAAVLLAVSASAEDLSWHFVPPAGSGVANVRDYGAKGDGVTDDTDAILKAISDNIDKARYRANPFIWFPNGIYIVSAPIEGRIIEEGREEGKVWSAGWRSMLILIGETRDGVVIKLKDEAPGYRDAGKPQWVIATGSEHDNRNNQSGGGNRAFRHNILNLTVDVGAGNPGAIGIDFIANNRGSIEDVTIRAPENSGYTAINLTRSWPGPAMVKNVSIDGFDHAMQLGHYQYGMTFEDIRMRGQRKTAIVNYANVVALRNVDFEGAVPFYESKHNKSVMALLDSSIVRIGGSAEAAISTAGLLNLRRVTFEGYPVIVDDTSEENRDLPNKASKLFRYDKGFTLATGGGNPVPLDLPIEETPVVRPPADAKWVDAGESGESLQAAIDGGGEYIFVRPVQTLKASKPVILRNKVKLIMGMHGSISGPGDEKTPHNERPPLFVMGETGAPTVVLEHLFIGGRVENSSKRTLVLRHVDIEQHGLLADGPGKTHVMDVIGRNYRIGPKHNFWARQLNAEFGDDPLFTNAGTSWIFGFKMESSTAGDKHGSRGTPSLYNKGGKLEVIAGLLYTLGDKREQAPLVPAFINQGGKIAISYRVNGRPETYYPIILRKGTLEKGEDLMATEIKDPGAALLTDER